MIIDVNGYYGTWPYWPLRGGDPDAILNKMNRCNIDRVFISSLKSVFSDPDGGNQEIIELVSRHPDRFYPAFTYSPYASGFNKYEEDCTQASICLVKLFPVHHTYNLFEEPGISDLLSFCSERGIPVFIPRRLLMSWRFPLMDLGIIEPLASKHTSCKFIIGSINYLGELQTAVHILRQCPNVYIETSAMMAFQEIENMVRDVGVERILHGSAIPLQNAAIGPLKINQSEISNKEKERILFKNTKSLWGEDILSA